MPSRAARSDALADALSTAYMRAVVWRVACRWAAAYDGSSVGHDLGGSGGTSMRAPHLADLIVLAAIWGASFMFIKIMVQEMSPVAVA